MAGKGVRINFRLSADESEAFKMAADLCGDSLSGWMRRSLRTTATKELKAAGEENPLSTSKKRKKK